MKREKEGREGRVRENEYLKVVFYGCENKGDCNFLLHIYLHFSNFLYWLVVTYINNFNS